MHKYRNLQEILTNDSKKVFVGHTNPDGDCIGSLTGLYNYITSKTGKYDNINLVVPNMYPYFLSFLDERRIVLAYDTEQEKINNLLHEADYIVCMDFNAFGRVDALGKVIAESKAEKILIDHHPQPKLEQFKIAVSKPELSSACEVVYSIIKEWEKDGTAWPVTLDAANSLYAGLVTDTNNFSNSVLESSFFMAGELLCRGVDKEWIQSKIYGGYSQDRMRLMGYMLNENMKVYPERKAALMLIDNNIKDKFNYSDGDSEGFVNLALGIKGVEVSALFTEDKEFVKVSLRSKGDFSVNAMAREFFNGGGHMRAAGGRLYIPFNEVESYFLKALDEYTQKA